MAAKPRVHEIAAELGIDSKRTLEKLKEIGEFVKGPSSTVEPPVARKLKAAFADEGVVPVAKDEPKKEPPKKPAAKPGPAATTRTSEAPAGDDDPGAETISPESSAASEADKPAMPKPGIPRPGNNPYSSSQGMGRPGMPRPGNNPFSSSQGMGRPNPASARAGAERAGVDDATLSMTPRPRTSQC